MSIRKKLILSNIAMIVIPVILFVVAVLLIISLVFGGSDEIWGPGNKSGSDVVEQEFTELKKIASISPHELEDETSLNDFAHELETTGSSLIVRKAGEIIYQSKDVDKISSNDLPAYGNDRFQRPVQWIAGHPISLRSYDFYFDDGAEGTIFLLQNPDSMDHFSIFPILFGILLLILIGTNILLSFLMSRTILNPVNELTLASRRISEGDLDFEIKTKKKDELGELSRTFDQMRLKLKESINLQLQYEENRKELVANISHDLKTPITSIKGYVEGIQEGVANTPEKMDRYLNTIFTKAVDMDHLIDELSLYSKLDLNRLPYDFQEVDFRSFMGDLMEEVEFDLVQRGVGLTIEVDETGSYHVLADREKIKRVVMNILNNSLKYLDKEDKTITIRLESTKEQVIVQIHDNGSGIRESALPFIFDRFYRSEPSRNTGTGGSGLGLAIAKRIVEDHQGKIWGESKPGKGTRIFFTIKKI
ncbi:cell wall metabolism sensor histidine kinase WalK [Bacillus sp. Marseille-Q3570]|uniref:sensor histidine kinase n=1 Tax=Bacillus sp. Marseille-Q3570 TaxID=2963522 RepID=UPI0021B8249E|nr:HAMP domain-containing sensor histidine kinase [Bacillus sp. Marseille-Q3570]